MKKKPAFLYANILSKSLKCFLIVLMPKIYPDRYETYDEKPLPVGKVAMLSVLMFIVLFIVGSLMLSGYFSTTENNHAPNGNENTLIKP